MNQVFNQRVSWRKWRAEKFEQMKLLLSQNGVMNITTLAKKLKIGSSQMSRILRENQNEIVYLQISWRIGKSRGGTKKGSRFIKTNFLSKVFIGLKTNRTELVRFFMGIFREDREYRQYDAKSITYWLKHFHLTQAERTAIITKLGYKYRYRDHMKINGFLDNKPHEAEV